VKWNASDFVLSTAQPRPRTTIARETHEIVKVLAPEYGWNANRIIVSRGDDAVLVVECYYESPKCRPVDQGLIGQRHQHSVARIVSKESSQPDRKRRSEPSLPVRIDDHRHRGESGQGWRNCGRVRPENYHHSTGTGVKRGDRDPPYEGFSFVDDQLLWETESRRCSRR
jgi:hypothetical protein